MMTPTTEPESYDILKDKAFLASLVTKAREGSREAFNQLMDLFHENIFRMVFYRIRSRMDAEDLTQDIFLQAFKNMAQLKTVAHFKAWLYRIAINRVRDFYRKKRFRSVVGLFSENETIDEEELYDFDNTPGNPLEATLRKDFWRQLEMAGKSLSRMEKEVFNLRFLDDLGIKEISQTLSRSESTVKTHLYRALKKMQQNKNLEKLFNWKTS